MSKHNSLKQFHANLVHLAIQGRVLLSCEGIGPDQVDAYKQLIDGVLEDSDMRLEDIDQLAASKVLQNQQVEAATYSSEAEVVDNDDEDELDVVETDATVDEIVDAELAEEEPVVEEVDSEDGTIDVLPPELDADADGVIDVDAVADDLVETAEEESLEVNDADDTAALIDEEPEKEPIQELEATVDKVDHIVQRVETYIAVTEDSGLTTDDVQAMAASNESFASIRDLSRLSNTVKRTASAETIAAFHRLTCLSLRNIGKAIQ